MFIIIMIIVKKIFTFSVSCNLSMMCFVYRGIIGNLYHVEHVPSTMSAVDDDDDDSGTMEQSVPFSCIRSAIAFFESGSSMSGNLR